MYTESVPDKSTVVLHLQSHLRASRLWEHSYRVDVCLVIGSDHSSVLVPVSLSLFLSGFQCLSV